MNPLGETFNYTRFKKIYEENKDKPMLEWLDFVEVFKPGKQGIVGLLKTKTEDPIYVTFKMSQQIDYLSLHENTIMEGLNELAPYCPHFCKSFGTIECKRNPVKSESRENPFIAKKDVKYMIRENVLLSEYIHNSNKFYNYIKSTDKVPEDVLYSTVKQVLLGISMAQREKKFAHYDLHSMNIMMKRCNKDVVFLYVLDAENQICVPALGHYPIIIDFGFSYIDNMNDNPLWTTLGHTSSGFNTDHFDWVCDPKLFLVTVSDEIKYARKSKKSSIFRRIVKNIFRNLRIDWECGWDQISDTCAPDSIIQLIANHTAKSTIFSEYEHYCIDMFNSLLILPLEHSVTVDNSKKAFKSFLKEWVKIENEISSPYYNLYILKGIVDAARYVRAAYMDKETSNAAVEEFKKLVIERIDEVTQYCMPKDMNYEKMLCSLYVFTLHLEASYFNEIKRSTKEKQKDYSKLPLKSVEQIYAAIDTNIQTPYVYNKNTTVFVMDSVKKESKLITLSSDQIEKINKLHSICRGSFIYDIYNSTN
jgi:hypothetical protein